MTDTMTDKLLEYFKRLGCDELPSLNEGDAQTFLRHRAMCRKCQGFDNCKERGCVMRFSLTHDKKTAYPALTLCPLRQARDARRKSEKLFSEAAIPPALQKCRLENYFTEGLGESVKRAKNAAILAARTGCSLVLAGGVGAGKTHLAAAIVQAALAKGRDALFISAIGYLERLKSTFEKKQTDLYVEMVEHVKTVSCLAIDDLGAERPSVWTIARLYDVINARVERGIQTIVTTNYLHAGAMIRRLEADPDGAGRIASRLVSFGWVTVEGEDYRRRGDNTVIDNLSDTAKVSDTAIDKLSDAEIAFLEKLLSYFNGREWIDNAVARKITNKSPAGANRYLRKLTELHILDASGVNKNRLYRLNSHGAETIYSSSRPIKAQSEESTTTCV